MLDWGVRDIIGKDHGKGPPESWKNRFKATYRSQVPVRLSDFWGKTFHSNRMNYRSSVHVSALDR